LNGKTPCRIDPEHPALRNSKGLYAGLCWDVV
jgi:hypothetical protein